MSETMILQSKRVVLGEEICPASVCVKDGKIVEVSLGLSAAVAERARVFDYGDCVIMPGLVDTHVHINEPGRTHWEGFETATKAAASGGITTLIDMPLNCTPVTTTAEALAIKREALQNKLWVDVGFWGGLVPSNLADLRPLADAGVFGYKTFMVHSGIDDFPKTTIADLKKAMPIIAEIGLPLLVHAELERDGSASVAVTHKSPRYFDFVQSRPDRWEYEAISILIELSRQYECHVHIVHLSSAMAIPLIRDAKAEGVKISVETCPHYLMFASEEISDGDTRFKCTPPIRSRLNGLGLWQGLRDGDIDFIVSDHSPCMPELKQLEQGDFSSAWGGIASLQFGLSSVWALAKERRVTLPRLCEWMSASSARFAGLTGAKGAIAKGYDADIVVWNPEENFVVTEAAIQHKHKLTPYLGRQLSGVVKETFVRGKSIYKDGKLSATPVGRTLSSWQG